MLRQGKERIKKFLKTLFKTFDPNDIWEVLIGTLNDISPDTKKRILTALQGFNGPLHVGTGAAILAVLPEQSEREQREDAIYNLVFKAIKEIVSNTEPAESSPEKIADHKLVVDGQQRALSDVIQDFDFSMVFNLIHTIHEKWNVDENGTKKSFDDNPDPKALFAIKGLINILTKIEQTTVGVNPDGMTITRERIVGLSHDPAINEFFCNCFRGIENNTLDKDYYDFVVRGIERCYINSEARPLWQAE